jgi:hypothetical protein
MIRTLRRVFIYIVMTALVFTELTQSAQAAMVSTDQIQVASSDRKNHEKISASLNKPGVRLRLEKMGVNLLDAEARVAALTDTEAAKLAADLDSLPAGGESVIGVLLVIFVVLLVTDILGFTKVFPFTRSMHK